MAFCNAIIGEKTFNLKRHPERNHPEVYQEGDGQDRQNKNSAGSKNQYEKNSRNSRETMAKFFLNEKFITVYR